MDAKALLQHYLTIEGGDSKPTQNLSRIPDSRGGWATQAISAILALESVSKSSIARHLEKGFNGAVTRGDPVAAEVWSAQIRQQLEATV